MPVTAETASPAPIAISDPNVITIAEGVAVDTRHLGALMTYAYQLSQVIGPVPRAEGRVAHIMSDKLSQYCQPHDTYRDDDGRIRVNWWNQHRLSLMSGLKAAPFVGKLLLSQSSGMSKFGTAGDAQRTIAETGTALKPSWGPKLEAVTARDAGKIVDFTLADLLPFATELDVYKTLVRDRNGKHLGAVEEYLKILTSGEQPGTRQEFQHEVDLVLKTVLTTARERAANRERIEHQNARPKAKSRLEERLAARPDDYLEREDVAAGVADAATKLLGNQLSAPMLNSLIQKFLGGEKPIDLNKAVKYIEIGTDFVIDALVRTLPADLQSQYQGLNFAAFGRRGAKAYWTSKAIESSPLVPTSLRVKVAEHFNMPGIVGARGKATYDWLRSNLAPALQALVALLPTNNESVRNLYSGAQPFIGQTAVAEATSLRR
jgi:hypothetical protein